MSGPYVMHQYPRLVFCALAIEYGFTRTRSCKLSSSCSLCGMHKKKTKLHWVFLYSCSYWGSAILTCDCSKIRRKYSEYNIACDICIVIPVFFWKHSVPGDRCGYSDDPKRIVPRKKCMKSCSGIRFLWDGYCNLICPRVQSASNEYGVCFLSISQRTLESLAASWLN